MDQVTYTFLVLGVTIAFFIWGRIRSDLIAVLSMLSLFVGNVLTSNQILSGFSNSTVVMIASLFVVGEGLSRTGVTSWLSHQIIKLSGRNPSRIIVVLMIGTAILSAFISNTGTVATLLPAVIAIAWSIDSFPSKLLIPLAFAANSGGLLTLTGTPPNIVVSDALVAAGHQPFGFFEYSYIGLPLLAIAILYMVTVGQKLLPNRVTSDRPDNIKASMEGMVASFSLEDNLYKVHVEKGSSLVGKTLKDSRLGKDYSVSVLRIVRVVKSNGSRRGIRLLNTLKTNSKEVLPRASTIIDEDDVLLMKGSEKQLASVVSHESGLSIHRVDTDSTEYTEMFMTSSAGMAELLIAPRSKYIGKNLQESNLTEKYGVHVISILRGSKIVDANNSTLQFGDALLVRGSWVKIELLRNETADFTVVGRPDDLSRQVVSLNWRALVAVFTLVGMVTIMVLGIVPTVVASLIAAVVMVLGGCLDMNQAYRSIGWQSVILISAMIPLSIALEVTGGAGLMANSLVSVLGSISPLVLMAGIFVLTSAFSQVINNTATAVLMAPIVLQAATVSGISPYPLLITVSISASTAFLTPIGTTTNLMVMTPGGYSFGDYLKVGAPLVLLFLGVSLLLVPVIWPF